MDIYRAISYECCIRTGIISGVVNCSVVGFWVVPRVDCDPLHEKLGPFCGQSLQICALVPQAKSFVSGGFSKFIVIESCPLRLL